MPVGLACTYTRVSESKNNQQPRTRETRDLLIENVVKTMCTLRVSTYNVREEKINLQKKSE